MSDYDQLTQNNENAATKKYDFWANVFTKFNPQAPQTTPVNSSPFYDQATVGTMANMPKSGPTGNFHAGDVGRRVGLANNALANKTNFDNSQSALFSNPAEAMKYGVAGLGRMDEMGNIQKNVNQLPQDRRADQMALWETDQNKEDQYNATKGDFLSHLLGGAGSIGGTLVGKAFGGNKNSNLGMPPDWANSPYNPSNDPAGIMGSQNMQLPSLAGAN